MSLLLLLSLVPMLQAQFNPRPYEVRQVCPKIQCVLYDSYMEPNNLCINHERPLISGVVKLRSCSDNPNQMCDLFSGNYAWTQGSLANTSAITNPLQSPFYGLNTQVKCKDKNDMLETNLNNGRKCLEDY